MLKLSGENSILGRGVIVHEKVDDWSQPVGDSGGRVACGVVEPCGCVGCAVAGGCVCGVCAAAGAAASAAAITITTQLRFIVLLLLGHACSQSLLRDEGSK